MGVVHDVVKVEEAVAPGFSFSNIDPRSYLLTGMRTTGLLHFGHLAGSMSQWPAFIASGIQCVFLAADIQALSTHVDKPGTIRLATADMVKDWIGTGVDPTRSNVHVILQSEIVELYELTALFSQITPESWFNDVPTIREERANMRAAGQSISMAFATYIGSQGADILGPWTGEETRVYVPVGQDQESIIEVNRKMYRRFGDIYGLKFPQIVTTFSEVPRLPGLTGDGKMSKSLNGSISLTDPLSLITKKVGFMESDKTRVSRDAPGNPDNARAFKYLDAFCTDKPAVEALRKGYREGTVGDKELKDFLASVLVRIAGPIQERRKEVSTDDVKRYLREGSDYVRPLISETIRKMKKAMALNFFITPSKEIDSGRYD